MRFQRIWPENHGSRSLLSVCTTAFLYNASVLRKGSLSIFPVWTVVSLTFHSFMYYSVLKVSFFPLSTYSFILLQLNSTFTYYFFCFLCFALAYFAVLFRFWVGNCLFSIFYLQPVLFWITCMNSECIFDKFWQICVSV